MTTGQRHAVAASLALLPMLAYEAREVAQGDDGWPYSRFLRHLPGPVFLGAVVAFNAWFIPHILRRAAEAAVSVAEAFDPASIPFTSPEED